MDADNSKTSKSSSNVKLVDKETMNPDGAFTLEASGFTKTSGYLHTEGSWYYRRHDSEYYEVAGVGGTTTTASTHLKPENKYSSTATWESDIQRSGSAHGEIVDGEQQLLSDSRGIERTSFGEANAEHDRDSHTRIVDWYGDETIHEKSDTFSAHEEYINSTAVSKESGFGSRWTQGIGAEDLGPYENIKNGDARFANVYGTIGYKVGPIGEADPEWGQVDYEGDWLDVASDFSAGVADTLSLGLTYLARQGNNQLIGSIYGIETSDLTNYNSTAYWAGQWAGEGIGFVAGGGIGAIKSSGKYLAKNGVVGTAKNAAKGVSNYVDDVVFNVNNKQCGVFKRLIGKGCFVAGTKVHLAALPSECRAVAFVGMGDEPQIAAGAIVESTESTLPIEQVPLGSRVGAVNPDGTGFDSDLGDASHYVRIALRFRRSEGSTVSVELLRNAVDFGHLKPGDTVPLQTREQELSGMATVVSVDRDFSFAEGDGNMVTGRYITDQVDLIAQVVLSNGDRIEGTPSHWIWNESEGEFVGLEELSVGDLVKTRDGFATVESVTVSFRPQAVYNLEVAGQHVYEIGFSGVLVHNNNNYDELANAAKNSAPNKGLLREQTVAKRLGGQVSREKVKVPGLGSTDLDVVLPNGDLIAVGGPAKAANLSKLGRQLQIFKRIADDRGVRGMAYFERGTPQSAIDLAKRWLGDNNVFIFDP